MPQKGGADNCAINDEYYRNNYKNKYKTIVSNFVSLTRQIYFVNTYSV